MEPTVLKTHNVPPSTNLRKVMAHSGYTLESALADIIDNCVSAHARRVELNFDIVDDEFQVKILDDGQGMSREKLGQAMIYGYVDSEDKRSATDIGRYSVGLKTASSTFCTNLLVYSKTKDSCIHGTSQRFNSEEWGYDEIQCCGDEIEGVSGTLVIWNHAKLEKDEEANETLLNNRDYLANLINRVKIYLSKAFCYYIKGDDPEMVITVNGQRLVYWSPVEGCKGIVSNFENEIAVKGSIVTVKTYILPPFKKMTPAEQTYVCLGHDGKIQDTQGFYVYRQHRLIIAGGWLGIEGLASDNKSAYARIVLNFDNSLDEYMSVNYEKDSIKIPEELADYLKKVAKRAKADSVKTYDYKRDPRPYRHRKKSDEIPVWSVSRSGTSVRVEVNPDNPLISGYTSSMSPRDKKAFFSLLSKTYPTSEFVGASPAVNKLSLEELETLVRRRYEELKGKAPLNEIAQTLLKEEPFCDDDYSADAKSFIVDLIEKEERKHGQ